MKQSRLKRWFPVWLRWVLGILLLPILAVLWGDWRAEREWQQYCAEARARGVKLTLAEFLPKEPIPDEDNFAAIPIFKEASITQRKGPRCKALDAFARGLHISRKDGQVIRIGGPKIDFAKIREAMIKNNYLPVSDIEGDDASAVLRGYEGIRQELNELREARDRKGSQYLLKWKAGQPAVDHCFVAFNFASILRVKAGAEIVLGESERALSDLLDICALAVSLNGELSFIGYTIQGGLYNYLFDVLRDGLDAGVWSEIQLLEIEKHLSATKWIDRVSCAFESERVIGNGYLDQYIDVEKPSAQDLQVMLSFTSLTKYEEWIVKLQAKTRAFWRDQQLHFNQMLDEQVVCWNVSDQRWKPAIAALKRSSKADFFANIRYAYADLNVAVFEGISVHGLRGHVKIHLAGQACALERYKRARNKYPEQLEDLIPDFLQKLPHDPFDGKPYRYRRTEDGYYLLYSIGMDSKDDGGVLSRDTRIRYDSNDQPDWRWWAPGQTERENTEAEKNGK